MSHENTQAPSAIFAAGNAIALPSGVNPRDVAWTNLQLSGITVGGGGTQFTLPANRTYTLEAVFIGTDTGGYFAGWVDVANANLPGITSPYLGNFPNVHSTLVTATIRPLVPTIVKFRLIGGSTGVLGTLSTVFIRTVD